MQRRISFSRPVAAFSTQWGSQIKALAEATKSWSPSWSCRSACWGVRITLAAITGMDTTLLISLARYLRQPGSKDVGSSQ